MAIFGMHDSGFGYYKSRRAQVPFWLDSMMPTIVHDSVRFTYIVDYLCKDLFSFASRLLSLYLGHMHAKYCSPVIGWKHTWLKHKVEG
jgi:hypothetical protein